MNEIIQTLLRKGVREHSTCAKVVDSPVHLWEGFGGSGGPGVGPDEGWPAGEPGAGPGEIPGNFIKQIGKI